MDIAYIAWFLFFRFFFFLRNRTNPLLKVKNLKKKRILAIQKKKCLHCSIEKYNSNGIYRFSTFPVGKTLFFCFNHCLSLQNKNVQQEDESKYTKTKKITLNHWENNWKLFLKTEYSWIKVNAFYANTLIF
jgi:hypothetical protein